MWRFTLVFHAPALIAILTLLVPAVRTQACSAVFWKQGVAAVVALSGFAHIVLLWSDPSDSLRSLLFRDVVAIVAIGMAAPLIFGLTAAPRQHSVAGRRIYCLLGAAFSVGLLVASPLLVLLVHCTSGDCL